MNKILSVKKLEAHYVFAIIASIFGLFFIFTVPPFWGLDESTHFGRVYQISHGNLNLERDKDAYSGYLPKNIMLTIHYSWLDLANNIDTSTGRQDFDNTKKFQEIASEKISKDDMIPAYQVANYSPLAYVGPIAGVVISDVIDLNIGQTLTVARVFSLVTYILIVGLAVYVLRGYKLKWFVGLFALMPNLLFNGSMVTADTMLISLSILLFALFVRYLTTKQVSKKLFVTVIIVGTIIPLVKVNYILLSLGVVAALPFNKVVQNRGQLLKAASIIFICFVAITWFLVSGGLGGGAPSSQLPEGVTSPSDQLHFVISHPLGFAAAIMRSVQLLLDSYVTTASTIVGWNYISVPTAVSMILLFALFLLLTLGMRDITNIRKNLVLPTMMSLLGIVSVFLALYLAHTPTALPYVRGVQGRYFIPFLIPIMAMISSYIPLEVKKNNHRKVIFTVLIISTSVLLWTAVLYYLYTY